MLMRAILLFFFGLIFNSTAFAGTATGQVTKIDVRASDGLVLFYLSGQTTGSPSCSHWSYWIIKDENSATGKRQLAMLLMAKATGQQVSVGGAGTCTRWPDGEDVDTLEM